MGTVKRTPNFNTRTEHVGPYEVRFLRSGTCQMSTGIHGASRTEPAMYATILRDGRALTRSIPLNASTMCQPGYSVQGPQATAAEIIHAVLCDEHIFSGEPSYPDEWATAAAL